MMRYVNGVLCAIMILFAVVQYNDPDFAVWIPIYGIPAIWAGVAAFRPTALLRRLPTAGLVLCTVAAVAGTVYMWPTTPGWWRQDVWWNNELAREGMGLMAVTLALLVVILTNWRTRAKRSAAT